MQQLLVDNVDLAAGIGGTSDDGVLTAGGGIVLDGPGQCGRDAADRDGDVGHGSKGVRGILRAIADLVGFEGLGGADELFDARDSKIKRGIARKRDNVAKKAAAPLSERDDAGENLARQHGHGVGVTDVAAGVDVPIADAPEGAAASLGFTPLQQTSETRGIVEAKKLTLGPQSVLTQVTPCLQNVTES